MAFSVCDRRLHDEFLFCFFFISQDFFFLKMEKVGQRIKGLRPTG